jgi:hypothetical protein
VASCYKPTYLGLLAAFLQASHTWGWTNHNPNWCATKDSTLNPLSAASAKDCQAASPSQHSLYSPLSCGLELASLNTLPANTLPACEAVARSLVSCLLCWQAAPATSNNPPAAPDHHEFIGHPMLKPYPMYTTRMPSPVNQVSDPVSQPVRVTEPPDPSKIKRHFTKQHHAPAACTCHMSREDTHKHSMPG